MLDIAWEDIAEYVAAGNLAKVTINENFDSILIEIVYLATPLYQNSVTCNIELTCNNCCYFDMRRRNDHEPGAGIILEAYLKTESDLITALHNHELDSQAGCLCLEASGSRVYHLEIIGEISLNILCEDVTIKAEPLRSVSML